MTAIPPECTLKAKPRCDKHKGLCKKKCNKAEREIPKGCQKDGGCVCCAKECKIKDSCLAAGGTCVTGKKSCVDGTVDKKGCKGKSCFCCIPGKGRSVTSL